MCHGGNASRWLKNLLRDDPEEYWAVFKRFRDETKGIKGGRGHKKAFTSLTYKEVDEVKKRSRLGTDFEAMTLSRYIQYFRDEAPEDERLTEAECRLAWMKDRNSGNFEKAGAGAGVR